MGLRRWLGLSTPRLNFFRTTEAVLRKTIAALAEDRDVSEKEIKAEVKKHLAAMKQQYFTGNAPQNPYDDPVCRTAYFYRYVPANANLFEIALKRSPDLEKFIHDRFEEESELKVCAFGGGPGTELLGLAKYLVYELKKGPPVAISFTLLDHVEEWAETWHILEQEIKGFLRHNFGKPQNWPFTVNRSFLPFDITSLDRFGNVKQLFGQDLYAMNYVVSEIFDPEALKSLKKVLKAMVDSAPVGSKIVIADRNEPAVIAKAIQLLTGLGLELSEIETSKENMDSDEECSDLGDLLMKDDMPRLTWNSFWLIGTKR